MFVFALLGLASALPNPEVLKKRQMAKLIREWDKCQDSLKGSGVSFHTPQDDSILLEKVPGPCMTLAMKEIKAIMG
ncbi:hypothetical protein K490DRAFT_63268 [Saccharata proteae CBS 121410]|uniref:Uncharacterized protein n=1 Tax=Saccharata proteae CBS 121410 TaxID=1314787 RepID=A0A9P4LYJ2_9PEZI|nr:hypothetical protein K490DRAFT_63268 [Saccharata proteae CBS 121410]